MKSTILFLLLFTCVHVHGQRKAENSFTLPQIKELKYLSVPTALENIFLDKSCRDSIFRFLKSYYKRLTDIGEYEVYLVKQNCSGIFKSSCICSDGANQLLLDLLVLHNKKSKQANVIAASYSFLSDSEVYDMSFKIKGNEIELTESGTTEGEGGKSEKFSKEIHKVRILKTGQIRIDPGKK